MVEVSYGSVTNLTQLQVDKGIKRYVYFSWRDYSHHDAFLVAKTRDGSPGLNFRMRVTFEINTYMHPAGVFFLTIFIMALIIGAILCVLYFLQKKGIIEIRIPKYLRFGWFKDYISPEEKAAIKAEQDRQAKIERRK